VPGKEERSEAEIVPRDPSKVADRLRFLVGLAGGIAALLGLFALLLFVVLEPGYDVFLSRLGVRPEDVGVDYIRAVTRGGYAIGLVAVELGLSALAATLVLAVGQTHQEVVPGSNSSAQRLAAMLASISVGPASGIVGRDRGGPCCYLRFCEE
jgi:hypothetical protein